MIYIVDITSPPIPPPCRTFKLCIFRGEYETKNSKLQTKDWKSYIKEYGIQLRKKIC